MATTVRSTDWTPPAHQYQPFIDGLRAIAVLAVVGNHLGLPGFFGGFIGVDIFYVISGFLITGIIWRDSDASTYSIVQFYHRRTLRIFPALYVMLFVVIFGCSAVLLPNELKSFSLSALATDVFASNIDFYATTDYFTPAATQQPLLHTWSLAIEEQFYVIWPVCLAAIFRRWPQHVFGLTLAICLISFGFSLWELTTDSAGAFFLIPARSWELLLGGLIALAPRMPLQNRWVCVAITCAGLAAILAGIKMLNGRMSFPFPGTLALIPCLGTAAILFANVRGPSFAGRLLGSKPPRVIGKISFSVYLWHWPVIFFAPLLCLADLPPTAKAAEFALSLILGAISWKWIEQPFRFNLWGRLPSAVLLQRAGMIVGGVGVICLALYGSGGWPSRFSPEQQSIAAAQIYDAYTAFRGGKCFLAGEHSHFDESCLNLAQGKKNILLIGDNHAAHLWAGLDAEWHDAHILQATATGCRPVLVPKTNSEPECTAFIRRILTEWLPAHPVDAVLIAGRWQADELPQLSATWQHISARTEAKIYVIGPIPQYATDVPRLLLWSNVWGKDFTTSALRQDLFELDHQMHLGADSAHLHYVSLLQALCQDRHCRTTTDQQQPMQFDYGHLTADGSKLVAKHILETIGSHS